MTRRGFAPRTFLKATADRDRFGDPIQVSPGQWRPRRFAPHRWAVPAGRTVLHLRASVAQNFWAGATVIALDRSLRHPDRGGVGHGKGSREKFATRIGMSPYRLSRVLRGQTMMDALDLGASAALPAESYPPVGFAHAASEVAMVVEGHWRRASRVRQEAPLRDLLDWPVSEYQITDRGGLRPLDDQVVTSDDGGVGYFVAPPFTAEDEVLEAELLAAAEGPLSDYLRQLWLERARVSGWTCTPPEPDVTIEMYRPGRDRSTVDIDVIVDQDGVGAVASLSTSWVEKVLPWARLGGSFVCDITEVEDGRPAEVLVPFPYANTRLTDMFGYVAGLASARVIWSHSEPELWPWHGHEETDPGTGAAELAPRDC